MEELTIENNSTIRHFDGYSRCRSPMDLRKYLVPTWLRSQWSGTPSFARSEAGRTVVTEPPSSRASTRIVKASTMHVHY